MKKLFLLLLLFPMYSYAQIVVAPPDEEILEEDSEEEVFEIYNVSDMPKFQGEHYQQALMNYVAKNIVYPDTAKNAGIEGTLVISFVVNADSSVSDIEIISPERGYGLEEAAIKVIASTNGMWEPALQRDKPVSVKMRLPITFRLD